MKTGNYLPSYIYLSYKRYYAIHFLKTAVSVFDLVCIVISPSFNLELNIHLVKNYLFQILGRKKIKNIF